MGLFTSIARRLGNGLLDGALSEGGGMVLNGILSAVGVVQENQEDTKAELIQISGQLTKMQESLNAITDELKKIEHLEEIQTILKAIDSWSNHNCDENISEIFRMWEKAEKKSATLEEWQTLVIHGDGHSKSAYDNLLAIEYNLKGGAETNLITTYAQLIKYQIDYQFPYTSPWLPVLRFHNYCDFVLQHLWYAAAMAKTANRNAKRNDLVPGILESYLETLELFEEKAFQALVDILDAVNTKVGSLQDSYSKLYEPFFTVGDFQFVDIFKESASPLARDFWTSGYNTLNKTDLANLKVTMGNDIEMFEDLMSSYRPSLSYNKKEARVAIYLSYWEMFFQNHNIAQKLEDVKIVDQNGKPMTASFKASAVLNLSFHPRDWYKDEFLDRVSSVATNSFYNFNNQQIRFMRWVFYVPFGAYKVDPGQRLSWNYFGADYNFMGHSDYDKKAVTLTEQAPSAMLRWSPWGGAYLMANQKAK